MRSPSCGTTGNGSDVDEDQVSTLIVSCHSLKNLCPTQGLCSDWTDEKHSLYLNSMEASFLDQLYTSFNSTVCLIHDKHHSLKHPESRALNQFKVGQNGNWTNRKLEKGESPPQDIEESHHIQGNQWTQHCRMGMRKHRITWKNISDRAPILNSNVGQEFSDQNFDEDDMEGGGMRAPKRAKIIAKSSSSCKYQVNLQNR